MVKACMPIITKKALRYELGVHATKPWLIVIGQIVNSLPNLEVYVCFQKLK